MKRLAGLALVVTVGISLLAYGLLTHSSGHLVQRPTAHEPSAGPPSAKASRRFVPIPNTRVPCHCTKPIPTFHGTIRPRPIGSGLWQGQLKAIQPTSITVGHITCVRQAPLDLSRFRVGALVVVNCQMGRLVGIIGAAPRGLYVGTVPIAPAP